MPVLLSVPLLGRQAYQRWVFLCVFVAYKHCADAHVRGVGEGNGLGCRGGGRGGGHLQLLLGDTQIYTRLYCNAL